MAPPEVLIFGAGAVGAFYGSLIAKTGTPVSVVCRSNYSAVKASGFAVTSPQYGSYTWTPTRVFSSADAARSAGVHWSYIVVTTKALPDVSDDSALLDGLVSDGTAVVLVQNGLGVEEPYTRRFPHASVLSAVTIVSASQPSHGKITHNRWTRVNTGPYLPDIGAAAESSHPATAKAKEFTDLLVSGGVKDASAYTHQKLQQVRWHKIAINASMNPSSVLSNGSSNAAMALDPDLSAHLKAVMEEVLTTAPKILGAPFPLEFATAEHIIRSTRKNDSGSRPSMWGDWESGRPMELEVILGNPIRIAREKGYEMPRMQTLYALLKMAQTNRDKPKGSKL
ncbi:hypothetical protein H072_4446 [Dactylellina haptotyla CBS 200.50]|uniref:2-dehydropantoate 2-reductase n=1 Tax=Dactylellina haptotyla (strain CBS 200.50) TaxID=1284197 RepID=S8BQD5_DACHA|nr:hypothetical protein H072_4446 [Dactylellina haptotyla CBS 200.50]